MDHGQCILAPGERQHIEHLAVVELQVVIGHVDLERGVAVADQGWQLLPQYLFRRIGNDQVEGIVDHRLAVRAAMIILDRGAQRLPLHLRGERNDRGGPAAGRRNRAAVEIVRADRPVRRGLVEVAMRIDPAGQYEQPGGIDFFAPCP